LILCIVKTPPLLRAKEICNYGRTSEKIVPSFFSYPKKIDKKVDFLFLQRRGLGQGGFIHHAGVLLLLLLMAGLVEAST
jgi:hypothetical protein